jgi:hypothetical protein
MPVNPKIPVSQYVVLWKQHPTPNEPEPQFEQYGGTYNDVAPALKELDRAAENPRCADARMFMRRVSYTELTKNAVEWLKENNDAAPR